MRHLHMKAKSWLTSNCVAYSVLAEEKEGFTQFYPTSDCNLMKEVGEM